MELTRPEQDGKDPSIEYLLEFGLVSQVPCVGDALGINGGIKIIINAKNSTSRYQYKK